MKVVRIAIIGGGMISHRHMLVYSNIQHYAETLGFTAQVVACAEVEPKRLKEWGEQYNMDEKDLYIDYREMLKRDDIDAVDVCVHNNLHTPISIEVMKAGKECYCEKPLASSYRDAKMLVDCAKKLGRKFHAQISSIMTPQTRVARDMIAKGKIGTPYYVNLEQCAKRRRPGYDFTEFSTDFYSKRIAGHGPSIDLGVYAIGQLLYVLGMPKLKYVNGYSNRGVDIDERLVTNPDGFGVEDICDGFARFEDDLGFHFLTTSANNYKDYSMTYILGSKGGIEFIDTDMAGGKLARTLGTPPVYGGEPELKFFGKVDGRDVSIDLNCDDNGVLEQRLDSNMLIYNDNQVMWLAYVLGILDDERRYNTPEIACQQLLFTDGIFLSQELGRGVTVEEIEELSPSLYLEEQEINSELVKFDVLF